MIRVDENYVIDVDSSALNYIAKYDKHKKSIDNKTGEERDVFELIGFYSTFSGALKGVLKHKVGKSLSADILSLECALKCVKQTVKEFDSTIEKLLPFEKE